MKTWKRLSWILFAVVIVATLVPQALAVTPVAYTVPWVASNPAAPHITYPGRTITLKGTSSVQGPTIMAQWDPGDGTGKMPAFNVTNQYNVSTTYTYSPATTPKPYTATLYIMDTSAGGGTGTATYPILVEPNGSQPQVDVAIDEGLWYLHTTMDRTSSGAPIVNYGDWTNCGGFACYAYYGVTALNIQAFEVNGHLASGPASDPYTDDVSRVLNSLFTWLTAFSISPTTRTVQGCFTNGTSCVINLDGNGDGLGVEVNQGNPFYQGGQFMDAIVASTTPNAVVGAFAPANIAGKTYQNVVQNMADGYLYCQNPGPGPSAGGSYGGGWRYVCQDIGDNSTSQWAAIGLIAGIRGFGITVDPNAMLWNQQWIDQSQAANGEFGYTSSSPLWGPYAVTPSGMVQMAMDGVGRGDTRWNNAECFLFDNFENNPSGGAAASLQAYTYGMFSFTKAMLLHNPGGSLQPITLLGQECPTPPYAPIDWYGDPTFGVAVRLVSLQNPAGYWSGNNYTSAQYPLETASSIIMLQKTIIVQCVNNLYGRGTYGTKTAPASVHLVWSAIPNASKYNVLRGTVSSGPYSLIGNTTKVAFADSTGLTNGSTYYYVLQPQYAGGTEICQSNEAKVTIPTSH
jgi:hypothetical protein